MVHKNVTHNETEDSGRGEGTTLTQPMAPLPTGKRSRFCQFLAEHKCLGKDKGSPVVSKNKCKKTVGNTRVVKKTIILSFKQWIKFTTYKVFKRMKV